MLLIVKVPKGVPHKVKRLHVVAKDCHSQCESLILRGLVRSNQHKSRVHLLGSTSGSHYFMIKKNVFHQLVEVVVDSQLQQVKATKLILHALLKSRAISLNLTIHGSIAATKSVKSQILQFVVPYELDGLLLLTIDKELEELAQAYIFEGLSLLLDGTLVTHLNDFSRTFFQGGLMTLIFLFQDPRCLVKNLEGLVLIGLEFVEAGNFLYQLLTFGFSWVAGFQNIDILHKSDKTIFKFLHLGEGF